MPPVSQLKAEARALRSAATSPMTHSQSLEAVAHRHGLADWNTARARAGAEQAPVPVVGQFIEATYLGHPVTGRFHAVRRMGPSGSHRVVIDLDQPVNVSAFEGMDVIRRRLQATIGPDGATVEKTSDGVPHLQVRL